VQAHSPMATPRPMLALMIHQRRHDSSKRSAGVAAQALRRAEEHPPIGNELIPKAALVHRRQMSQANCPVAGRGGPQAAFRRGRRYRLWSVQALPT
jgi:hypothetical protein